MTACGPREGRSGSRSVEGVLVLPQGELPDVAAAAVVQVEDISRADAPQLVLAEQRREHVRLVPGGALSFEVAVPLHMISERRRYSVAAHVDISGSGEVERGDLITMQSYPVLIGGDERPVVVELRRV